jgi:hypothetical protein
MIRVLILIYYFFILIKMKTNQLIKLVTCYLRGRNNTSYYLRIERVVNN